MLFRCSLVSLILVCIRDHYAIQIQLNICLSWLYMCLMIKGMPCDTKKDNIFLLFNEATVSLYLYILVTLTDYNNSENSVIFDNLALALVSIVILAFLVNLSVFLYNFWKTLVRLFRKLREKCNKKMKKVPRN